jgi:hypothetical protein
MLMSLSTCSERTVITRNQFVNRAGSLEASTSAKFLGIEHASASYAGAATTGRRRTYSVADSEAPPQS